MVERGIQKCSRRRTTDYRFGKQTNSHHSRKSKCQTTTRQTNLSLEVIQLAKDFLLEASAFRQFCDNLRIWVFPVMSEYIESVIRTSLNPEGGIYIVECRARWELLQYWRRELSGTNALSEILTITGSPTCAQATSASDYIEGIWGSQARTLLSAIESNLALGTCRKSSSFAII
jgi:hypothetical protein